jgi:hypothetical protein
VQRGTPSPRPFRAQPIVDRRVDLARPRSEGLAADSPSISFNVGGVGVASFERILQTVRSTRSIGVCVLGMRIALQRLEIDALALTPLLEEAEAFRNLSRPVRRTAVRMPVSYAKVAERACIVP